MKLVMREVGLDVQISRPGSSFHRTVKKEVNSTGILRLPEAFSSSVETNGGVLVCFLLL